MDKEGVVHIHNGILSHKRNAFESVLMKWMNLLYRVESERERYILYSNAHIWNLEKMVLNNLFTGTAVGKQT